MPSRTNRPLLYINEYNVISFLDAPIERMGADFVYSADGNKDCVYRPMTNEEVKDETGQETDNRTKSGCLIGEALKDALPNETYMKYVWDGIGSATSLLAKLKDDGIIDISDNAVLTMQRAQSRQDSGQSWGTARNAAQFLLDVLTDKDRYNK